MELLTAMSGALLILMAFSVGFFLMIHTVLSSIVNQVEQANVLHQVTHSRILSFLDTWDSNELLCRI